MFVCLCRAVTSDVVGEVVAQGARTSREVADACGAGADCGRCRRTVRAIIATGVECDSTPSNSRHIRHRVEAARDSMGALAPDAGESPHAQTAENRSRMRSKTP